MEGAVLPATAARMHADWEDFGVSADSRRWDLAASVRSELVPSWFRAGSELVPTFRGNNKLKKTQVPYSNIPRNIPKSGLDPLLSGTLRRTLLLIAWHLAQDFCFVSCLALAQGFFPPLVAWLLHRTLFIGCLALAQGFCDVWACVVAVYI